MGIKKMSLATIQGKLSRQEMKNIMAGSGGSSCATYCHQAPNGGYHLSVHCSGYCTRVDGYYVYCSSNNSFHFCNGW